MKARALLIGLAITYGVFALVTNGQAGGLDTFKGQKGTLKLAGGTAHIPVLKEVAKRIRSVNPDIHISIAGGGSGVGIKQVGEGLVDIGNSGRRPKNKEIQKYNLKLFKWAVDGVAVIVHPTNKVKALTRDQVRAIYSGKIENWKQVGGADKKVDLYTRHKMSGTRSVFWKKALKKGEITSSAVVVESNGAMIYGISHAPNGIGYVSVGYIDDSVAPVELDGVMPTQENVKQGKYKISRGLYSSTKGDPKGLTKKLIDYLLTPEIQKVVADKGFIPVK